MESVLGIIIFIAVIFGFILFMQFMSKISGKNIRQKGRSTPSYTPEDFDNTMTFLKGKTGNIETAVKKIGKTHYQQLLIDFDKFLKSPQLKFSFYLNTTKELQRLVVKLKDRQNKQEEIAIRRQKDENVFYDYKIENIFTNREYVSQINSLKSSILLCQTFSESDLNVIIRFLHNYLKSEQEILDFMESLGCENIRGLAVGINKTEDMFLKNQLSKSDVDKIKLYVLKKKGFVDHFFL